jgi:hypothetical protein
MLTSTTYCVRTPGCFAVSLNPSNIPLRETPLSYPVSDEKEIPRGL